MIYKIAMAILTFTVTSISVGGAAQAVTAAQKAYDACAGFNNATFRYMAGHKAAYAGLARWRSCQVLLELWQTKPCRGPNPCAKQLLRADAELLSFRRR
jgi:hypothetical protein